jgi:RNA polymerase sigma-70 factor (ECF subfamily)
MVANTITKLVLRLPQPSREWSLADGRGCWSVLANWILTLFSKIATSIKEQISTNELIAAHQQGQSGAFETIYDRFKDYVYRVALYVTRNSSDAEEAVQETFLDVLRALPRYRIEGPARFETWLYRVTVNRCRSRMRRKRPPSADWDGIEERLESIPTLHPDHDPEGAVIRGERAAALWRAVNELPEAQRMVVFLRYQQGLSYAEIADALRISEGTVKSRLHHAHRKLKESMPEPENRLAPAESRG